MLESSKEAAALQLLHIIAAIEGKNLNPTTSDDERAPGPRWVFKTYAKCMDLVENPQAHATDKSTTSKSKETTTPTPATSRKSIS